tara:strand:- start:35 stop:1036 length:1002 start_codon:yes stop_codon:yes gene_type:complete
MKNLYFLLLICLFSCSQVDRKILVNNHGRAQGSYYHIKYLSNNGLDYKSQIDSIFIEIDSSLSIYQKYSTISRLNERHDYLTDTLFNQVFKLAKKVFIESQGRFDCSIGTIVDAWGFYNDRIDIDSIIIDSIYIQKQLSFVGFDKIKLVNDSLIMPKGMKLDFNALAQGFTVDLIGQYLDSRGIHNYLIEVGGELIAKGMNINNISWRVGVEKPTNTVDVNRRYQYILDLDDKSLATSGNYRKFYKKNGVKYSHTINPINGFPVQNRLLSVTVIHDQCILADAYATAFMVMGVKETKKFLKINSEIEAYLVYTNNQDEWVTYITPNFKNRIVN